ncbi:D-alanine--poly(phosphoribitol) ligase [Streptomyces gamaensis]|uniref:D-alanine--poly(Phosphoribitol) ligase n=1 Tax=Streptomyces gamaensis TaxID=1763542 RepID=A0ABW0YR53_9ACTN
MTTRTTGRVIRLRRDFPAEHDARPAFVGPEPLTYAEFTARVDALSSRLLDLGLQAGDRAAIWMDKHPRYAEAIVATVQAACAYVPVDGGAPPARVRAILADAEPVVLFTDARHLALLEGQTLPASLKAVVTTGEAGATSVGGVPVHTWADFARTTAGRITIMPVLQPCDLAAILYTSGSTGVPKGVQITHRNLANFIGWARAELDVGADDVFANHASFNFDLSTFDLFVALSVGAAVWIVEDSRARDVAALADGIREHGVTVWYSVPSILHLLTASGVLTDDVTASLRYVLFAGEVFPIPQLRAFADRLPAHTALYNLYGPTETNVCTYHRVRPKDLERDTPVPIGRPVPGACVSVVDDGRAVELPGAVGELIVEGDCVTPGYWRRADEPAAALHCQGRHPTGDLVTYEDGLLVYRGRKDRMVKLHGYRVELGEIEAAVLRHPAIAEAAVLVAGGDGTAHIALYYTLRPGALRPGLVQIKQHCARLLPRYMLPRTATRLDELPHNANGKTDYRQLDRQTAHPTHRTTAEPAGTAST